MPNITLPDGTVREYDQALSVSELASSIGPGLVKAAVAGRVNGLLVDCAFVIRQDARVSLITAREPQGLEILRRSCALLLGMALKQLHAKVELVAAAAVGDGFFCDFTLARVLGPEDLQRLETRMIALAAANHSLHYVLSSCWSMDGAALSEGPYVPSTGAMSAFALTDVSGKGAQRIYGVCWTDQQELQAWQATPQVVVINIDERQIDYSQALTDTLRRLERNGLIDRHPAPRRGARSLGPAQRAHCQQDPPASITGGRVCVGDWATGDGGRFCQPARQRWRRPGQDECAGGV